MSWHVTAPMTGAANRSHSRRWVSACLRDQRSSTGQPVGVQVVRDQVRARPLHVRRAGRQPLGDLLQLGGQLRLGRALPVLALPVLGEGRPPRLPLRLRRVHHNPALQLNYSPGSDVLLAGLGWQGFRGGRGISPQARGGR